jgi:uncharacterized protein (DUF362 family)
MCKAGLRKAATLSNEVIEFLELQQRRAGGCISRRAALQSGFASAALIGMSRVACGAGYVVGVGRGTDAYAATLRALDATADWQALPFAGKVVVIKPNLVGKALPQTGITTDSQVVRALADRALAAGAIFVAIIEAAPGGANFKECGYTFFDTYDASGRVRLLDLGTLPTALVPVNGWIFGSIYAKPLILNREFIFISAAKLKMHAEALVTLGTKNLFGLPAVDRYISWPPAGRFAMHDRGLNQAILDNFLLRPPDFTVIDGIIGMEGNGPSAGYPVAMNTVLAGRNTLAVDRVGLAAMGLADNSVRHLNYMALLGHGPASLGEIEIRGDTLQPKVFLRPPRLPVNVDPARVTKQTFAPGAGQSAAIQVRYYDSCDRQVAILRVADDQVEPTLIRSLASLGRRAAGVEDLSWDGRTDAGALAAPGRYAVHVRALRIDRLSRASDTTSWVTVQ